MFPGVSLPSALALTRNAERSWPSREDISQRINLVSHTSRTTGNTPVYSISDPLESVGSPRDTALSQLNADLVDVAFVDEPIQCDPKVCAEIEKDYKFGARKDWTEGNQYVECNPQSSWTNQASSRYKYLLDIGKSPDRN